MCSSFQQFAVPSSKKVPRNELHKTHVEILQRKFQTWFYGNKLQCETFIWKNSGFSIIRSHTQFGPSESRKMEHCQSLRRILSSFGSLLFFQGQIERGNQLHKFREKKSQLFSQRYQGKVWNFHSNLGLRWGMFPPFSMSTWLQINRMVFITNQIATEQNFT